MSPSHLTHLHGHWYFTELRTTDPAAAAEFYGRLFGWTFQDAPGTGGAYRTAWIDDRRKAAITGPATEGDAAEWYSYLNVDDLDAIAARVPELGGTVLGEIRTVPGQGRGLAVADPAGARFSFWQDAEPGRTTLTDEHGSPFWWEQHSTDNDAAMAFYVELFGWRPQANQMGPDLTYYVLETPDDGDEQQLAAGGMMQQMASTAAAGTPSTWFVYFHVTDADATHDLAVQLGATVAMPPHDIPGVGRSTWLVDPTGAMFAAMTPIPPAG